jgi:hypothetical protein
MTIRDKWTFHDRPAAEQGRDLARTMYGTRQPEAVDEASRGVTYELGTLAKTARRGLGWVLLVRKGICDLSRNGVDDVFKGRGMVQWPIGVYLGSMEKGR